MSFAVICILTIVNFLHHLRLILKLIKLLLRTLSLTALDSWWLLGYSLSNIGYLNISWVGGEYSVEESCPHVPPKSSPSESPDALRLSKLFKYLQLSQCGSINVLTNKDLNVLPSQKQV